MEGHCDLCERDCKDIEYVDYGEDEVFGICFLCRMEAERYQFSIRNVGVA